MRWNAAARSRTSRLQLGDRLKSLLHYLFFFKPYTLYLVILLPTIQFNFHKNPQEEETKSLSRTFSFNTQSKPQRQTSAVRRCSGRREASKSEQLKPSNKDFFFIMIIVGALRAEESSTQETFCPRLLIYKA